MNSKRGFSLVEMTIILVVLAILASLVGVGLSRAMANSRDDRRGANSTLLTEKLEKYYDENGEYPSVPALAADKGAAVDSVTNLLGIDSAALKMPRADSNLSIVSPESPEIESGDVIIYEGASEVNKTFCANTAQGGCDAYTLRYMQEDGDEVVIKSRRDSSLFATVAIAPIQPTIVVGQNGTNVEGESTNPNCEENSQRLVAKYRFQHRLNNGSWIIGAWQTSNIHSVTGVQGTTFTMQVSTRCDDGELGGAESPLSDADSYTYPVGAPAPPTVTVALNAASKVQATSSVVTCASGTVAQYSWRTRTNQGTWGSYSTFTTSRLSAEVTPAAGSRYGFTFQARCFNTGSGTAGGAASSVEGIYTHPIASPATPSASVNAGTRTWSWTSVACPSGTTRQYQYQFTSSGATAGSWVATTSLSATNSAAVSQGITYGLNVQARCYTSFTTSSWTASDSASFTVPVVHSQVRLMAVKMNAYSTGARPRVILKTFSALCASGLSRQALVQLSYNTAGTNAWVNGTGWISGATGAQADLIDSGRSGRALKGDMVEFRALSRCINNTTNYATNSAGDPWVTNMYDIGNVHMHPTDATYRIKCAPVPGYSSYCSGGYSAAGNLYNSNLRTCAIRSGGIATDSESNTPPLDYNDAPPCWSA